MSDTESQEQRIGDWFVTVVRVDKIEKHPNADTLGIVNVLGGYPVLVKLGQQQEGDLMVYCAVDSLVPISRPEFAFLDQGKGRTHERVKARKLRGIFSMGLLVPAPDGVKEGQDVADLMGVLKYEPSSQRERKPQHKTVKERRSETARFELLAWLTAYAACFTTVIYFPLWAVFPAMLWFALAYGAIRYNRSRHKRPNYPYYDIPSLRRWSDLLLDGEDVVLTEKIHGSQFSACYAFGRFHIKSRTVFRGNTGRQKTFGFNFDDVWTGVAKKYDLETKLKKHPNMVLFGEIYGDKIQKQFNYGCAEGEQRFAAFDVMNLDTRRFLDWDAFVTFCNELGIPRVSVLYCGPWSRDLVKFADGKSTMPGATHCREGWVCKPAVERHDNSIGRLILKYVSEAFLLKNAEVPEEPQDEAAQ